jgi:ribosomal protein S27AE
MNGNPGVEAVRKLAHLGYRFVVNGETIKGRYEGPGEPDPDTLRPLLETVKAHKPEVLYFLKSFCPRCGGCCFVSDYEVRPLCLACDWGELVKLYPGMAGVKH